MTSRRAKLHEDTNFRLMRILEANSDLSQREMGKALGISFGGIHYCLNALVAKGLVKIENFSQNQNKFGYVYLLTPSGIAEKAALTSVFLQRKMEEYEALKVEIAMLRPTLPPSYASFSVAGICRWARCTTRAAWWRWTTWWIS